MNNLMLINNHSFVDVITNSSSELFVLDTDKSLSLFKDLLNAIIIEYNNKVENGDFDEIYENITYSGDKVNLSDFDEPYIYTKDMYEDAKKSDDEYLKKALEKYNNQIKNGEKPWYKPHSYLWGYEDKQTIGKIILKSSSSNSIPYSMWDMINCTFNGVNYHLG